MAKKAKKAKKTKKRVRQNWCQMVLRVKVPLKDAANMRAWMVYGIKGNRGPVYMLDILNAYYDLPGQPNALD